MLNIANEPLYFTFALFDDLKLNENILNIMSKELLDLRESLNNDQEFVKLLMAFDYLKNETEKKIVKNIIFQIPAIFDFINSALINAYVKLQKSEEGEFFEIFAEFAEILKKVKFYIAEGDFLRAVFYYKQAHETLKGSINEKMLSKFFEKRNFVFYEYKKKGQKFISEPILLSFNKEFDLFEAYSQDEDLKIPLSYLLFETKEENEITKDFFDKYLLISLAKKYSDKFKFSFPFEEEAKNFREALNERLNGYEFYKEDKYNALISFKNAYKEEVKNLAKMYYIEEERLKKILTDFYFEKLKEIIKQKAG